MLIYAQNAHHLLFFILILELQVRIMNSAGNHQRQYLLAQHIFGDRRFPVYPNGYMVKHPYILKNTYDRSLTKNEMHSRHNSYD